MAPIKAIVNGVSGKMGQEVLAALCRASDIDPVGGADVNSISSTLDLPDGSGSIPISSSLDDIIGHAQVVIDFTNGDGATSAMRTSAINKVNIVVGSTGIPETMLKEANSLAHEHDIGILIAPNFAMGAVLMTHLAKLSSRFFDYADLTEMHHEGKIDAPSGTALSIAKAAVTGKGSPFKLPKTEKELVAGTRGGTIDGVTIHSARMPGRIAHHELVFGALGQTLSIRHDSINRESFMPGVLMAIRHVVKSSGLVIGLETIMGL